MTWEVENDGRWRMVELLPLKIKKCVDLINGHRVLMRNVGGRRQEVEIFVKYSMILAFLCPSKPAYT